MFFDLDKRWFFLANFPASQPVSNYNSMWKNNWLPPELPLLWKKKWTTHMWDARSRFDHNNNACHNKTTSLALLLAQKKNMFVEREETPRKKERNPSSWLLWRWSQIQNAHHYQFNAYTIHTYLADPQWKPRVPWIIISYWRYYLNLNHDL